MDSDGKLTPSLLRFATKGKRSPSLHRKGGGGSGSTAMDLTPLVVDPDLDPAEYVAGYVERFAGEVGERLRRLGT